MQRTILIFSIFTSAFGSSLFGACQLEMPNGNLTQQLQATYAPTLMDASGYKVAQPGCTLVVQLDGIAACPSTKTGARSVYENGQVTAETKNSTINSIKRIGGHIPGIPGVPSAPQVPDVPSCGPASTPRNYMMGEKVYLVGMEIRNTGHDTGLIFSLQSCGTCDPAAADPAHTPYRADLRVSLLKNFLTATDLKQIKKAVSGVLTFPDDADGKDTEQESKAEQPAAPAPAQTQQPTYAPIAPPPPADAPAPAETTTTVSLVGQTPDQVKAALGNPVAILSAGKKQIYTYKNFKVTFQDGKVSDIE